MSTYVSLWLALSIFVGMHAFVYRRIQGGLRLAPRPRYSLLAFLALGGLLFLGAMIARRSGAWAPFFLVFVHWLGFLAIGCSGLFLEFVFSLLFPEKRRRIVWLALILIGIAIPASVFLGRSDPVLREVPVAVRDLPDFLEGYTIVHLSDLHLGHSMPAAQLQRIVSQVNGLNSSLVVITGDVFDRQLCETEDYCRILSQLRAAHGVWAVSGNHDVYNGIDYFYQAMAGAGIGALRNRLVVLENGLQLVGMEDDYGSFEGERRNPRSALQAAILRRDSGKPILLLSHRPTRFADAVEQGILLQLSGHTHAGQIPPTDFLVWLLFRYSHGLYREGNSYMHTSAGTSTWGPRMRLFTPSEIVRLTLTRE